jgi:hypothetical protein
MRTAISTVILAILLRSLAAHADTLTWKKIGGPQSPKREIIGLKSEMTDKALDAEALRACPHGYQSDNGAGFTKPDGSTWWRFTFFCLDPKAEGSTEAARVAQHP